MARERWPDAWLGRTVVVSVDNPPSMTGGELVEVHELGIVLRITRLPVDDHAGGSDTELNFKDIEPHLVFYPWGMINRITVPESHLQEQ